MPARADTLAGNGTQDDPYLIKDAEDLIEFAEKVNGGRAGIGGDPDACAVLTANINLEGSEDNQWLSIGLDGSRRNYIGTFDGQGFTISGLYINTTSNTRGLFGYVGEGGTVTNLIVKGTVVSSGSAVYGDGGIVGDNAGTVSNCVSDVAVKSGYNVGGVVGWNRDTGIITNCTNNGTITGTSNDVFVGGVVGTNCGTVQNCTNNGTVETATYAGGVVGVNFGTVSGSYNTKNVAGVTAGGVVGANSYANVSGKVTSCYNTGTVSGTTAGGVIGTNYWHDDYYTTPGNVNSCYNTGKVTAPSEGATIGGVVGVNSYGTINGTVDSCYFLEAENLSGVGDNTSTNVTNVASKTDAQFNSGEVAWLLQKAVGGNDSTATQVWGQDIDTDGYPVLTSDPNKKVYQATFDYNYDDVGDTILYTNSKMTKPADPTRQGHAFDGWYSDENLTDDWNFDTDTVTKDITLYAKWTLNQYTVTFNSNGGSDVDSLSVDYGDTVTKPADPTREGYTFDGWYSDEDFKTAWDFENDTITADTTLYAKWTEFPTYTVTVAASSHGSVMANPTSAAAGETVTLTIAPETGYTLAGLNVADANGTAITVNGSETTYAFTMPDSAVTVTATFRLIEEPVDPTPAPTPTPDPDPSGPSTGESDGWESIADEIAAADDGDSITIDMNGETEVPSDIFEDVAGKDVDLVFDMGDGLSWSVNGQDIPEGTNLTDLDLGVDLGTDGIPVDVINAITGEKDSVQITLAYDGDFGFTLTAPLGEDNAGYWANLYHYDEDTEAMNFEAAAEIGVDGSVSLPLSHASQYAIVIDDHSHAATDVSEIFTDVPANHWAQAAIQYVYDNGLMTGISDSEFAPEATTTRAMIVSMLARMENVTSAADAGFADVAADDWYATAVNWAAANGIVNGVSDDTFAPNDPITREQLAAMLMNYAEYKGIDTSARADLDGYTDQPSAWASEAVQWAVADGLLAGVTDDELQPQGQATRALVAAIMQRFLEA